jgi:FkbH-like protein
MDLNRLSYNLLIKNLKKSTEGFRTISIAILADFASQHYAKALRSALVIQQINASVWEADYNSVDGSIFSEHSELYQNTFDFIIIVPSAIKLNKEFSHHNSKPAFAEQKIRHIGQLVDILQSRTRSRLVFTNYHEYNDGVFGNYANKTEHSFLYQLRKLNFELMRMAVERPNFYIADAQSLFNHLGKAAAFDPKLYIHGDIIFSLDFLALLAYNTSQIIAAIQGNFKKCVIVDLDNTMWGGIIGDDGIENIQVGDLGIGKAFTGLQNWLLDLKNRGIILAVCSKNNDSTATEVFEKHPGMVLRMSDISVFVANWETKVDNILFIQSVLNIGFDSIVFLDDNPFERGIVQQNVPGITVPDLPEDPAEYVFYLQSMNLFETASFSGADLMRTRQYQEEAGRMELQKSFANEAEFLQSLNMTAVIKPIDNFTAPRVAQLTQRSNQFNLRTIRYTDEEVRLLMNNPDFKTLTVSLTDKYGDYGLISAVFMEKKSDEILFVDTWIMSCRVLKRGVESFVLNEMVNLAEEAGYLFIEAEYIPTQKNAIVKDHYPLLGFQPAGEPNKYRISIKDYKVIKNYIHKSENYANY